VKKLQRTSLLIMLSITVCATVLYAVSAAVTGTFQPAAVGKIETAGPKKPPKPPDVAEEKQVKKTTIHSVTISAAGDVTIGTDENFPYMFSFPYEVKKNGYAHFGKHIRGIFDKDDLTIVNLETTLTTAKAKAVKKFRFKGAPDYAQILTLSGMDAVNLANNHTRDYLRQGYEDTIKTLKKYRIAYFGYDNKYIAGINSIPVGLLGYEGWENTQKLRRTIMADIAELRRRGTQVIIVSFHWGVERSHYPNAVQKALGRHAINQGADLVLGHHPHVMQGIEQYRGKYIVYSLGNFMFGGNRNPSDKDTFIFQQTFYVQNGKLSDKKEIRLIPALISSVKERNNYQPLPLEGAEAKRVLSRLKKYTNHLGKFDWSVLK